MTNVLDLNSESLAYLYMVEIASSEKITEILPIRTISTVYFAQKLSSD